MFKWQLIEWQKRWVESWTAMLCLKPLIIWILKTCSDCRGFAISSKNALITGLSVPNDWSSERTTMIIAHSNVLVTRSVLLMRLMSVRSSKLYIPKLLSYVGIIYWISVRISNAFISRIVLWIHNFFRYSVIVCLKWNVSNSRNA